MSVKAVFSIVSQDEDKELTLQLGQTIVIGRKSAGPGLVTDASISGTHCQITFTDEGLKLYDLQSKNGTYLNGIRVDNSEMFMGDEVRLGGTLFKLVERKMDSQAVQMLTFPGPHKERINHELRVDFTGARLQNQTYNKATHHGANAGNHVHSITPSHHREIVLRQKVRSELKLSKHEILLKHRSLAIASRVLDISLIFVCCVTPVLFLMKVAAGKTYALFGGAFMLYPSDVQGKELVCSVVCVTGVLAAFVTLNYQILQFTIGEKVAGIHKLYLDQG
jgi:hypothetical protein